MEYTPLINLSDSCVKIFGTMDGFSLVKWILKLENPLDVDVYCRLSFDFLDERGETVGASDQWKWFSDVYSKKQSARMDRGGRCLIKANSVKKISGVVKTATREAINFAGIDGRICCATLANHDHRNCKELAIIL